MPVTSLLCLCRQSAIKPCLLYTSDFPNVVVFGKQAENCERFLAKGRLVGVQGRIQTGSYTNKDGATVYTKMCIRDRYYYKVQVRVYDADGKLAAKTALKQCKYASRTWTKGK